MKKKKPLLIFGLAILLSMGWLVFSNLKSKNTFYFQCEYLDYKNRTKTKMVYKVEGDIVTSYAWNGEGSFKVGKETIQSASWKITKIDSNIIRANDANSTIYVNFVTGIMTTKLNNGRRHSYPEENCRKIVNK